MITILKVVRKGFPIQLCNLLDSQFPVESKILSVRLKTVVDFADQLGLHPNYLNRMVKKYTCKYVLKIINERIITEAHGLEYFRYLILSRVRISDTEKLEVPGIGLGCMGMSWSYGKVKERNEMISLTRSAFDQGITFFDTAEVYGPLANEELVGEALAPFRKEVVIVTKFGFEPLDTDTGNPRWNGIDSRLEYNKKVVKGSLKRLKTNYLDLYYQHRVDHKKWKQKVSINCRC